MGNKIHFQVTSKETHQGETVRKLLDMWLDQDQPLFPNGRNDHIFKEPTIHMFTHREQIHQNSEQNSKPQGLRWELPVSAG